MHAPCPIVGMGASAGGLEAFERFFNRMHTDSGMGFVLVMHLDARHRSAMTELVQRYTQMKVVEIADGSDEVGRHLARIYTLLRTKTGHDFSRYKDGTFLRRVQRRMQLSQLSSVTAHIELLRKDPREIELLFRDLLIGVTHFFRDQHAFDALASGVIPKVFAGKNADDQIRVWVPGCSTGEEAYFIAILLSERLAQADVAPKVQIGLKLIERGLAEELQGKAALDFASNGLSCSLEIPLEEAQAVNPAAAETRRR